LGIDIGDLTPAERSVEGVVEMTLDGFEGKLTSSKWAKIEQCFPDTALRDICIWSSATF
jgi:hypothetical protein